MKEIKKNQAIATAATVDKQFTTQATITTPDGKPVVSLNDLKATLPVTRWVKKPKYSDLWKETPVLTKLMPDGGIWVYANGFMIYRDASSRPYVLRVSEIKSQTYEFSDKTETCSLDALPWETALFIFGDEHRERNQLEWNGRTQVQYDGFDDCDDDGEAEGIVLTASDNVENEAVERVSGDMERMLGCLTERQRQIVQMYYFQDMNQQQIADKLGISQPAIVKLLNKAATALKKYKKNLAGGYKTPSHTP